MPPDRAMPGCSRPWLPARPTNPFSVEATIANKHRTLGARLAGELVWHGLHEKQSRRLAIQLADRDCRPIPWSLCRSPGMQLVLEGHGQRLRGQGACCGGELVPVSRARARRARESELHVIRANVALYGATSGSLFAAGRAGGTLRRPQLRSSGGCRGRRRSRLRVYDRWSGGGARLHGPEFWRGDGRAH